MLRLGGVLVALAWVVVGWRNLPPLSDGSALAAGLAIGGTCFAAYLLGRRSSSASAVAVAVARAEARSRASSASTSSAAANVFVVNDAALGRRSTAQAEYLSGLDSAPWIGPPVPLVEQDVLESMRDDVLDLEVDGQGEYDRA